MKFKFLVGEKEGRKFIVMKKIHAPYASYAIFCNVIFEGEEDIKQIQFSKEEFDDLKYAYFVKV